MVALLATINAGANNVEVIVAVWPANQKCRWDAAATYTLRSLLWYEREEIQRTIK